MTNRPNHSLPPGWSRVSLPDVVEPNPTNPARVPADTDVVPKDIERLELEALPPFPPVDAKPKTGRELLQALWANGLVGIWKDRDDIGDSSTFAGKLRKKAQTRTKE